MNRDEPMPGLTAYDRRWVMTAEDWVPVPRGEPAPFDRDAAFLAWREGVTRPRWLRDRFPIPRALERAAAVFWFFAVTSSSAAEMRALDVARAVGVRDAVDRICKMHGSGYDQRATSTVMSPLAHVFEAAHPCNEPFDSHTEARMRNTAEPPQIQIPVESLAREFVFSEPPL